MYVTQHTLVSVAKLKGFEIKLHGHYFLILRLSISTVRLDVDNDVIEACISPYMQCELILKGKSSIMALKAAGALCGEMAIYPAKAAYRFPTAFCGQDRGHSNCGRFLTASAAPSSSAATIINVGVSSVLALGVRSSDSCRIGPIPVPGGG
jgi:hypothetical protein